jgi:hypothetical protein
MTALTTDDLVGLVSMLGRFEPDAGDAERIDRIRLLEEVKAACAAAQAREAVAFRESQVAAQRRAGVRAERLGVGISAQVALARRESPFRGARLVGLAEALVHELPHTMAALEAGRLSEWRATIVVRETACLTREQRGLVDEELAAVPGGLASLGDRGLEAKTREVAYRLAPYAFAARASKAAKDRRVTLRPAPDTMTHLSGLLPVAQGVAVYAALVREAEAARARGDERTRGQVMADTLVERVTGQASARQVPIEVQLVMTDATMTAAAETPGWLAGYGPVPAPVARDLVRGLDEESRAWLRRLWTAPDGGELVAMESSRRAFTGALRRMVVAADRVCRTPWCDAPVRHADHVVPVHAGGATRFDNAQGLCEACNQAKEAPGWQHRSGTLRRSVETTTPTGHRYASRSPALSSPRPARPPTRLETYFAGVVLAA